MGATGAARTIKPRGLPATAYCPGGLCPEYRRRWRLSRPCSGWERVGRRRSSHGKPSWSELALGVRALRRLSEATNREARPALRSERSIEWRTRQRVRAPSAIRTGRLRASPRVHPRPIEVVVCHRPYLVDPVGGVISGPASRLDAVSASPSRTAAARRRPWRDDRHTGGPSAPVLSYWGRPPSRLLRPRWIETELSHDVLNPARVPL